MFRPQLTVKVYDSWFGQSEPEFYGCKKWTQGNWYILTVQYEYKLFCTLSFVQFRMPTIRLPSLHHVHYTCNIMYVTVCNKLYVIATSPDYRWKRRKRVGVFLKIIMCCARTCQEGYTVIGLKWNVIQICIYTTSHC